MANRGNRSTGAVQVMGTRGGLAKGVVNFTGIRTSGGIFGFGGGSIAAYQGIYLGAPTSLWGDTSFGRHLQVGVLRNNTEGNPGAPALQMDIPGFWRFRWAVKVGSRSIQINVKQAANGTPRPTLILKANPGIGLASDLTVTAGSSTGWVTLGPATFSATAAGAVWVELHNNYYGQFASPTYFDHIVAT